MVREKGGKREDGRGEKQENHTAHHRFPDPGYAEARMNIARLQIQLGQLDAEKALKDVIKHHPGYAPAYFTLAEWLSDGYEDRRVVLYERYLELPPGAYRLAVQLTDLYSDKWGLYHQDLDVPAYGDSLKLSDLELAWGISKTRGSRQIPERRCLGGSHAQPELWERPRAYSFTMKCIAY